MHMMITEIAKFNKNRKLLYWTSKNKQTNKKQFLFPLSTHCPTSKKQKEKEWVFPSSQNTEKMRGKESEVFVIFISSVYFVFLFLFIFRSGPDVPDRVNV